MSPAWPTILAASTSLIPKTPVREVPLASTAAAQRVRFSTSARSTRRRSTTRARAIALRSRSTTASGRMEAVDHGAALLGELIAAIRQEPQDAAVVLATDTPKIALALGHPGHAGRVDAVGLAPVAPSEQASPRRQGRRHVQHRLLARDELLRQEVAETGGALHRPGPVGPALGPAQEPFEHGLGRGNPQLAEHATCFVERDGGVRRLVGIDPDRDHAQPPPMTGTWITAAGNLNSGERLTPLSSH